MEAGRGSSTTPSRWKRRNRAPPSPAPIKSGRNFRPETHDNHHHRTTARTAHRAVALDTSREPPPSPEAPAAMPHDTDPGPPPTAMTTSPLLARPELAEHTPPRRPGTAPRDRRRTSTYAAPPRRHPGAAARRHHRSSTSRTCSHRSHTPGQPHGRIQPPSARSAAAGPAPPLTTHREGGEERTAPPPCPGPPPRLACAGETPPPPPVASRRPGLD